MAFVRKIKASLVKIELEDYISEETYIFYDIVSGELRIHDGTPGGKPLAGGAGGGTIWGGITGTLSNQTDLQTALDNAKEEEMFASQIDFINDDLLYRGEADPGTATSDPLWRIRKITIDNAGEGDVVQIWADGNDNFDNIWNDRLGLSYS